MQMIKNPAQFQVIVTCNMFGDIISDLGAQLQGGLGLAASANINPGNVSMFEPVHGSAPKYAGKNVANPVAAILTGGHDAALPWVSCGGSQHRTHRGRVYSPRQDHFRFGWRAWNARGWRLDLFTVVSWHVIRRGEVRRQKSGDRREGVRAQVSRAAGWQRRDPPWRDHWLLLTAYLLSSDS